MNEIKEASADVKMPKITNDINKEIEFDEMWHFIGSEKMDLQSC